MLPLISQSTRTCHGATLDVIALVCKELCRLADFSAQFGVAVHADAAALQVSLQNAASVIAAQVLYHAFKTPTTVAQKTKLRTHVMEVQALLRRFEVPPDSMRGFVGHMKAALKYQFQG